MKRYKCRIDFVLTGLQLFPSRFKTCFCRSDFSDVCEITLVSLAFSLGVHICLFVCGLSLISFIGVYIQRSTTSTLQESSLSAGFLQSLLDTGCLRSTSWSEFVSYLLFPWKTIEDMDGGFMSNGETDSHEDILRLPSPSADYIVVSPENGRPVAYDGGESDDSDDWWLQSPNGNHFRQVTARRRQMSPCQA